MPSILLTRVVPERDDNGRVVRYLIHGPVWINPHEVVAFGPLAPVTAAESVALDNQGNGYTEITYTEILLSTGHQLFVVEIPSEVNRKFEGRS